MHKNQSIYYRDVLHERVTVFHILKASFLSCEVLLAFFNGLRGDGLPSCITVAFLREKFASVNLHPAELPAVELLQNVTLDEGSNLTRECNVTAGNPSPTVFWETGYTFEGNPLTITNITRSHRGEYICIANNTCGRGSAMMFIDVQCKNIYRRSLFVVFIHQA